MARDCCAGPEWRSMMRGFTPRRATWLASIRPVGPAPTMRTSVSTLAFRCDRSVMAIILTGSRSFALVVGRCQRFNCRNGRTFLRECLLEVQHAVPKGRPAIVYRPFRQDDAALV